MIDHILIDSNIWYYAYIQSTKKDEYQELHTRANDFLIHKLADNSISIAITSYQIAEIMELLRKGKIKKETRKELFYSFMTEKFLNKEIPIDQVKACFEKSIVSNIHIYDYLVALPLKGIISTIYSADDHLQHEDFKKIATVSNPLSPWILREGRIPIKNSLK